MSKLLSPRTGTRDLHDLGERSSLVGKQRIGRTRRPRARTRFRPVVLLVLVAALLTAGAVAGVRWLLVSPRFALAGVDVRGTHRVSIDRIVEAADLPAGISIFAVDTRAVAARVEALPEVRRAEVIRELPNRMAIVVEERRPFTLLHTGRFHWVDEEARAMGEERQAVVAPVPLITGLTEDDVAAMRTAPGPKAQAAIAIIQTLMRRGSALTEEIAEIDVRRHDGPVLYTMDGIEVRLGNEDWGDRLARLEGVLAQVARDEAPVSVVDLRFRDQVVLRRGGQP